MEGHVTKVLMGIVGVILLLSIIGSTIGTIDTATDKVGVNQRCADAGCFYNSSRAANVQCTSVNTTNDPNACASQYQTAFSGETLFSGGLLTTIVLLVSLMIIVGVAWIKAKNR